VFTFRTDSLQFEGLYTKIIIFGIIYTIFRIKRLLFENKYDNFVRVVDSLIIQLRYDGV